MQFGTGILHRLHITYNQLQPVYHTIYTSPTTNSNRYTTPSTHHLHVALKLTTSSITPHTLNNFNSQDVNQYPFLTTFVTLYFYNNITLKMAAIAA